MSYKKIMSLLSVLAVVAAAFMIPGPVAAGGAASVESLQAATAEKSVSLFYLEGWTEISSTSKIRLLFGGILEPAPFSP